MTTQFEIPCPSSELKRSDIEKEIARISGLKSDYKKSSEDEIYFDNYLKKLNQMLDKKATKKSAREANL